MAVQVTTNRVEYVGDGASTVFGFNYYVLAASHVVVTVDGVTKTLGTDYTVSGVKNQAGGSVNFTTAPASNTKIVIRNMPPYSQLVDFVNNITVLESVLDDALDKLTILAQSLQDQYNDALKRNSLVNPAFWNGQSLELRNLADAAQAQSAVTRAQLIAAQIAAGNVPPPLASDVGKVLKATAVDDYSWQTTTVNDANYAKLDQGNTFNASNPQVIRRPETSLEREFIRFLGGDGTGINASFRAVNNATDIVSLANYLGTIKLIDYIYNSGTPYIEFLRQAYAPFQTLTDAATINWNLATQQNATVTLGGNRSLAAPTNMRNGGVYNLLVKQDSTGGRTLGLSNSTYKFPDGAEPIVAAGANAVSLLSFISDGASMFGVATLDFS